MFVPVLACCTALLAADKPFVAHADHVIAGEKMVPDKSHDPVLCSNVGPANNQFGSSGNFVAGPNNTVLGISQFMAVPCTPQTNRTLTTVKGAWQWYGYGANKIQICLYADSGSNSPGTQIGNCVTLTNLPTFLTSNTLVTANFTSQKLALTAGTQYWIIAQTPSRGTGSDSVDVWVGESGWMASDVAGEGWSSSQPNLQGVMSVSGK